MSDYYCRSCDEVNEFYDETSKSCIPCHPACYGCKGKLSFECIECKFAANPFSKYECVL